MSPSLRTHITELSTGLGVAAHHQDIEDALANGPPNVLLNVGDADWRNLLEASTNSRWHQLTKHAFSNGRYFLQAEEGLGGVLPRRVEWKGPQKAVGDESIPADLRVNRVYLISCKYDSKILHNSSPHRVFELLLSTGQGRKGNWYSHIAPDEFQSLYAAVKSKLGPSGKSLPNEVQVLNPSDRQRLKGELQAGWPGSTQELYAKFSILVSRKSAQRWERNLKGPLAKELMVHRLIRLCPCPYFILGLNRNQPVRLRVDSPWDWRQKFELLDFSISSSEAGQPEVDWRFTYKDKLSGSQREVEGHVEVRWSHGRFNGNPEGKVYLDSDPLQIPGYNLL